MSGIKLMEKPEAIDLDRHGVIEAHAGTGKTYTIIQMVLRILERKVGEGDGFIHLREVLLVTYTDKAAGELRRRIRKGLEDRIRLLDRRTAPKLAGHLEDCLNNLHEALIGTIHGVCLRLLRTWPFETGVPFTTETVDDAEGIAGALRESIRTDWQQPETGIPWALTRLQTMGLAVEEKQAGLVREIALKILDRENSVIDRRTCGGYTLGDLRRELDAMEKAADDKEAAQGFRAAVESLVEGLRQAKSSGAMKQERVAMLDARVGQLTEMCRSNRYDTAILSAPCCFGAGKIFTKPDYNKIPGLDGIDALCGAIAGHPYLALLDKIAEARGFLMLTLLCDAAVLLRDRWLREKRERGLVSFQDMLGLMHKAVFGNPSLCAALRRRLRYGIIDEFQDTNVLQWRIFEKLFLDPTAKGGPRFFVVGDPKQSIYGFQGADVQSYLDAKNTIRSGNGSLLGIVNNYRSLPEIIDGYNAVFERDADGDWFKFDDTVPAANRIAYPSEEEGGTVAMPPSDRLPRPGAAIEKPVQVMALAGSVAKRRATMAAWASTVIRSMVERKTRIAVPDGLKWNEITLDYKDFAVIVESHKLARSFLERFQADNIPAVKYKMEGVFQSAMARDLHALLRAILRPAGDPAPRLAALLTRFFNRGPADLDPERDLEPCSAPKGACRQGKTCIFHGLEEWTVLASRQRWSRLFKSIHERTGVRELLITLPDGKRCLADLRQTVDYAIEKLYRGNFTLERLVEQLGRLLDGEERLGQDQNLHVLATGRSCVKVLTMHAAKGLEFPVVFAATDGSKEARNGPSTLTVIDDRHIRRIAPYLKINDARPAGPGEKSAYRETMVQAERERRRLIYVALTRAQARLFMPVHLKHVSLDGNGAVTRYDLPGPRDKPDCDLTPRLLRLLMEKKDARVSWFAASDWPVKDAVSREETAALSGSGVPGESVNIEGLHLASLICRQTSYTELSREVATDRAVDRSEESGDPAGELTDKETKRQPVLPGGKKTGDALHLMLEEVLRKEDPRSFVADDGAMNDCARKYLEQSGVLKKRAGDVSPAIAAAAVHIKGALEAGITLPGGMKIAIVNLAGKDRVPEMEFQLRTAVHWVHGYMDLVFRVHNEKAKHPYRYFVLDWKSDRLERYDKQHLANCMVERHYDLQAKIYCHALDHYLQGILGSGYDPAENLGGAVYVFLRSFQNAAVEDAMEEACHVWTRPADPQADAMFTFEKVRNLALKRTV